MRGLDGKNALITGAARGIGAATARRLAAAGVAVGLLDIHDAGPVAEDINRNGGRALSVTVDVSDESAWESAAAAVRDAFGPIGVLVSNAATVEVTPAHLTSRQSWDHQLAVSLTGTFLGARACLADLRAENGAVVVVS